MSNKNTQETSNRWSRAGKLIMKCPAGDVPVHSGTSGAGGRASNKGRPAAAHDWEEGPVTRPKGWGECPADRRSAAPVVPPSPHAPRGSPPVLAGGPTDALISW